MDARIGRLIAPAAATRGALLLLVLAVSMGARQQTANFIVETPDPAFARQVAQAAEHYRRELAVEWLGKPMPDWAQPCVMTVQVGPHLGAGGATTFVFDRGEVFGWRMSIQGPADRLLDSVLPHEITHMIFASRFRQPVPRWADEGGATTVEHQSERDKYRRMLYQFLRGGKGIAFNRMFAMTEYPADIMPLYAQGYSLADYLIQNGGRRRYVEFVGDGMQSNDWYGAVARHYGVKDLGTLQNTWLAWVAQGSPQLSPAGNGGGQMLAADGRRPRPAPNLIHREQNPPEPARGNQLAQSGVQVLPAAGWRAAGSAAKLPEVPSATAGLTSSAERSQVPNTAGQAGSGTLTAHPQPLQQHGGR